MRDLAARLREIIRREKDAGAARPSVPSAGQVPRELTYVPDIDPPRPHERAARQLGGTPIDEAGACLQIDRVWTPDRSHGRRRVESCLLGADAPMHLFDARVAVHDEWWRRVVFFDIETTGLSGGAGTLAFLAGCAWFDEEGLRVRQFFLGGPAGERALLAALARVFGEASLLVTFNGRTFDVPLMETRWAFHRSAAATDDLPHLDMLPPSRRLWGQREHDSDDRLPLAARPSCSLSSLERAVLGFHRLGDVPGFEIPMRYFQFLRTGQAQLVEGVLDHNRHDLVSLAVLTGHAMWLAREGPDACRDGHECVALGRLYERARDVDRAGAAYERAVQTDRGVARRHALARLATLRRREGRHAEAADAWEQLIAMAPGDRRRWSPLERRAAEALAIHHEHRARDPIEARRYAQLLSGERDAGPVAGHDEVRHRLDRLDRKIDRLDKPAEKTTGGQPAARLFQS
jgi:uncharacterized protein YprB with RNaseH-like and TPR domain